MNILAEIWVHSKNRRTIYLAIGRALSDECRKAIMIAAILARAMSASVMGAYPLQQ